MSKKTVDEHNAKLLLSLYDIPVCGELVAETTEGALRCAEEIGYPVALKVLSPEVAHKTEKGGIRLNIADPEGLRQAADSLNQRFNEVNHSLLVQEMVEGVELIVGSKKDAIFGQTILFGLGGVYTELFKDISIRLIPITKEEAREMVEEVKAYKLLKGYRGSIEVDINGIVDTLVNLSRLIDEHDEILELDINPLIASHSGVAAVDALIIKEK